MRLARLLSLPYLARHKLRALLTLAGIALGVALLVAMHTANESVLAGLRQTVTQIAGGAQWQITAGDPGVPEAVLERVSSVPEVGSASGVVEAVVSTGRSTEGNLLILGVDLVADRGIRDYGFGEAEVDDPLVFLAQPDSLLLSADFAARNGLTPGRRLILDTARGAGPFTVRGLLRTEGLGRDRRLFVFLSAGLGAHVRGLAGRWFQITYAQLGVAILVAVLGIANALTVSIADRRRELAILRTVGGLRRQIRVAVWMEAAAVAVTGFLLGLALGAVNIAYAVSTYSGHQLEFRFPAALAAALLAALLAAALIAALTPAEAAVRAPLASALESE